MACLAKKVHVESDDSTASIIAAMARIDAIPVGKTLIDNIPDADWNDDAVAQWEITVGSRNIEDADELDHAA